MNRPSTTTLPEVVAHYEEANEAERLRQGEGQLELARTQEILTRYLPAPPTVILDVAAARGFTPCGWPIWATRSI
jgi:hypothetical protein